MASKSKSPPHPSRVPLGDIASPEITAFIDYWESLRHGAFAPSWNDFDLAALDPRSIPYVVVADVVREPLDFFIRFWGTAHVNRKGVDKTGKSVSGKPNFRGDTAFDEYRWVVEKKEPVASRDMVNLHDFSAMLPFEQTIVRLPLSDDGTRVDHVVSLAVWEKL